ncbi:family 43 glycosylhydrolase [Caldithrix abyssi]
MLQKMVMLSLMVSFIVSAQVTDSTYTNPIENVQNIGDPFVLQVGDTYYLYATSNTVVHRGFFVWTSKNLLEWQRHWLAFDNTLPENTWGKSDFWAPEVMQLGSTFYMVYSARAADGKLKLALAKSDDPLGPFKNFKAPLLDSALTCIDGHFFLDDDGKLYLFYVKDCSHNVINGKHVSQIFVQQMTPYSFYLVGEPQLCLTPSQGWENPTADWQWNEGPFVLKHEGVYYLMYSANYFASPQYAIGYATATQPFGPWSKFAENPILQSDLSIGVSGPGHNSAAYSPDGKELFVVYHTHTDPDNPSGDRILNIDRMYFENGRLIIQGPTRTPQPLPSGATLSPIGSDKDPKQGVNYRLLRCYPNPFNNQIKIEFELPASRFTNIDILDRQGRRIKTLWSSFTAKGKHAFQWLGDNGRGQMVSSGVYFCRVQTPEMTMTQKISFIK